MYLCLVGEQLVEVAAGQLHNSGPQHVLHEFSQLLSIMTTLV
jgi:hypothetical protein